MLIVFSRSVAVHSAQISACETKFDWHYNLAHSWPAKFCFLSVGGAGCCKETTTTFKAAENVNRQVEREKKELERKKKKKMKMKKKRSLFGGCLLLFVIVRASEQARALRASEAAK